MKQFLLLSILSLIVGTLSAQNYVLAQLTGSPVNTTGWNLTGNAAVGNTGTNTGNNEILITGLGANQSGGIFYDQPINIVQCDQWTVDFEFRMFDGSGADGIAFCLLDVPPIGFVTGGGVGIPASSNGLKVVFDTYNNCGAANPAIQIRYGAGYVGGECDYTQPTLDNTTGQLAFLRSDAYNSAHIEYNAGVIDVYVNNTLYLSGNFPITFTSYVGFTASTGSANDRQSIRNVTIQTNVAQPDAYVTPAAETCTGVPIQLGVTNNPNYEYVWTPTTGLDNPNVYNPTLTLTNSGITPVTYVYKVGANIIGASCVLYDSVSVTINPTPTATFTTDADFCIDEDGTITYTGSAAPDAVYNWGFGGGVPTSGTGQGPYQVNFPAEGNFTISLSVVDNGCPSPQYTHDVIVTVLPEALFSYSQSNNYNLTFNSFSQNASSVQWQFGNLGNSAQSPATFNFPSPGTYPLTLIATNSCGSDTLQTSIVVFQLVGLTNEESVKGISLFPNPADDNLNILLDGYQGTFDYCITDVSGKMLACQNKLQGPQATVDVSGIASGMYFITLKTANGSVTTKLVVR